MKILNGILNGIMFIGFGTLLIICIKGIVHIFCDSFVGIILALCSSYSLYKLINHFVNDEEIIKKPN